MGALIQTKGTQRLARHFNDRFDTGSIDATRAVVNGMSRTLRSAFADGSLDLLAISDMFIAQNGGTGWPSDGNDFLYPSATMVPTNTGTSTSTLQFRLPAGVAAIPDAITATRPSIVSLDVRSKIPRNTTTGAVSGVTGGAGGTFSVTLVDPSGTSV